MMTTRPIFNDRLVVNLPEGMKGRLQEIAAAQSMTLSTYLRMVVVNNLQEHEAQGGQRAEA